LTGNENSLNFAYVARAIAIREVALPLLCVVEELWALGTDSKQLAASGLV